MLLAHSNATMVDAAIKRWRAELLDLSRRNHLLYFQPGKYGLPIEQPEPEGLFQALAYNSRTYKIYQSDGQDVDVTVDKADQLALGLDDEDDTSAGSRPPRADEIVFSGDRKKINSTIYRYRLRARSALIEHGVSVLYLTFGTLKWLENADNDDPITSPLILVPVQLHRETALSPYELSPLDDGPILNPSLIRKLETDFQLSLALPDVDDSDTSLQSLLEHIRGLVRAQRRWQVHDDANLGVFTFSKYAMYQDLESNQDRVLSHPVIRLLAGDSGAFEVDIPSMPSAEIIDREVHPKEMFQILDADASQLEAIEAVKRGTHLIIHGPPGTGKSQTITNIIAETLAQQKTVLFVSEKMAALQVVANRLESVGLKDFYLEAHSQNIRKAEIVRELHQAMVDGGRTYLRHEFSDLDQLATLRRMLNTYVDTLHDSNNSLGLSPFKVHGILASKMHAPSIHFQIDDIGTLTRSRIASMLDIVNRLSESGALVLEQDSHPWRGYLGRSATPQTRSELESRLRLTAAGASKVNQAQAAICSRLSLPITHSLIDAKWLILLTSLLQNRMRVPPHWMQLPSLDPIYASARDYRERADIYRQRRGVLLNDYDDEVLVLDVDSIIKTLTQGAEPFRNLIEGDRAPVDNLIDRRDELTNGLTRVRAALTELKRVAADSSAIVGEESPLTISGLEKQLKVLRKVLTNPWPRESWFTAGRLDELLETTTTAIAAYERRSALHHRIAERFDEGIYGLVTPELLHRFETTYASPTRTLKIGYRKDIGSLKKRQLSASKLQYADALASIKDVLEYNSLDSWFAENQTHWLELYGPSHFYGEATEWHSIASAIENTRSILESVPHPGQRLIAILTHQSESPADLEPLVMSLNALVIESKQSLMALQRIMRIEDARGASISINFTPISDLQESIEGYVAGLTPIWSAYDQVADHSSLTHPSATRLLSDLREVQEVRRLLEAIDSNHERLREEFGDLFSEMETDWSIIAHALEWSLEIRRLFDGPLPSAFLTSLISVETPNDDWNTFKEDVRLLDEQVQRLRTSFDESGFRSAASGHELDAAPLHELSDWASDKLQNLWRIEEWIDLGDTLESANREGISDFVEAIAKESVPPELWVDAFERQLYGLWLSSSYLATPELERFSGDRHEDAVAKFRERDRSQFLMNAERVRAVCLAKRPNVAQVVRSTSEPGILRRDANRRRRFRPLRRLFADLPTLLPALKPCMLMSPLSVSQYLGDSPITFDLVIFDEASQVIPADAIGSIARGKQIVIVGDEHQLPPTRFFRVSVDPDLSDDEDEELPESILDACLRVGIPVKPLRWHYRSKHEDLIAFSNRTYYNDLRLVTFPSPDSDHRAVEFVHVPDGIYKDRHNIIEAIRVVDAIVDHARQFPHQSIGVITFSAAQEETIDHALNARKRSESDLEQLLSAEGPDSFFIKNLENVQGDERDVIFFSVGYGPDELGRMRMHFGPLTQRGGERRLNVAVTRARLHVKVFASFLPDAIDLRRTTARGTKDLRSYLEFAIRGPVALDARITSEGGEPESPFEEAVARALAGHDLDVVTQIGVGGYRIDMAIRDNESNRYLLGIECDGATYHSSQTARDRDRLRQSVLENLGWSIHRIWSTAWLKDPDREVQKVLTALEQARERDESSVFVSSLSSSSSGAGSQSRDQTRRSESTPPPKQPAPRRARQSSTTNASPVRYESAYLRPRYAYYEFSNAPISELSQLVEECVRVESPVHVDRVIKAVTDAYGVQRVRDASRARMGRAISAAITGGAIEQREDFLWLKGSTVSVVRTENERMQTRPIAHVAQEEIALAIIQVLERHFAMPRADLATQVARELGYGHASATIKNRITLVINTEVANKTLRDIGGQISRQ